MFGGEVDGDNEIFLVVLVFLVFVFLLDINWRYIVVVLGFGGIWLVFYVGVIGCGLKLFKFV